MKQYLEIILLRFGILISPSAKARRRFRRSLDKRISRNAPFPVVHDTAPPVVHDTAPSPQVITKPQEPVPYEKSMPIKTNPKLVAFYLPQFHPFPENDEWWGKGFTEWANVTKATPLFYGHHQPHLPMHFGFYDLRLPQVMEEQSRLAQEYGIGGFAYYFYWFRGKTLMETPLKAMLDNKKISIPFCLIWANESWTRRWDGLEHTALIKQEHSLEDSSAFFDHVRMYFEDERYIKIDGKPLLVIYRSDLFDDCSAHLELWRKKAEEAGYPGIHLVCAQVFGTTDPRTYGYDAAMQFPPHGVSTKDITTMQKGIGSDFSGHVFDYGEAARSAIKRTEDRYKVFPTVMLSWDNTARRNKSATIFSNFSLDLFKKWLAANAFRTIKDTRLTADEKIIFLNAWNEWAEGAHLEPDRQYGFAYLDSARQVMREFAEENVNLMSGPYPTTRRSDYAVVMHLHFEDAIVDLVDAVHQIDFIRPDIYATATSIKVAKLVQKFLPHAFVEVVENRGRDVRPFVNVLRNIDGLGYSAVCKIHGKMSSHRQDGTKWRNDLIFGLCSRQAVEQMLADPKVGVSAPEKYLLQHDPENSAGSREMVERLAHHLKTKPWDCTFPAGTMFWFRPKALRRLETLEDEWFDVEDGQLDGTAAHAIERLVGSIAIAEGYQVASIESYSPNLSSIAAQ